MLRRIWFSGVLALWLAFPWPATTLAFDGIVVFGDSLSDNGPQDGYGLRVSSNGRVWADYLAEQLGVGLLDMAYASAQTDYHPVTASAKWGFCWQVAEYLNTMETARGDTLYIIWIGGNDLVKRTVDPGPVIEKAVANILHGIDSLIGAGAENILVMNQPNLGVTPLMNGHNLHMNGKDQPHTFVDNPDGGAKLAQGFNAALNRALTPYPRTFNLLPFDVFALMNRFIAEGVFDNSTHMLMANQPTDKSYVFWDRIHPTDDAHRLIAEAVCHAAVSVTKPAAMFRFDIGRLALTGARTAVIKDMVSGLPAGRRP